MMLHRHFENKIDRENLTTSAVLRGEVPEKKPEPEKTEEKPKRTRKKTEES